MPLPISPETESRERAAHDGVTIDELLNRFLAPAPPVSLPAGDGRPAPAKPVSEETREETHARVMGLLHKWQKETGTTFPPGSHKTHTQLSAEWEAEDANLTDEEREADRQFWEDFNRERDLRPLRI